MHVTVTEIIRAPVPSNLRCVLTAQEISRIMNAVSCIREMDKAS